MKKAILLLILVFNCNAFGHYVQVGDSYSKQKYKYAYGKEASIDALIENTVLINSNRTHGWNRGTGFYIGQKNGKHIFVTNAHVMNEDECKKATLTFLTTGFGRSKAICDEVIFSHYDKENSDITVFSVRGSYLDDMLGKGLDIDWEFFPVAGTELAFAGFGLKRVPVGNPRVVESQLKRFTMNTSFDSDCVISTETDALFNLSSMRTNHVFGTGCDAASGDSGSAFIDRRSGKVVGLLFGSTGNNAWMPSSKFWELVGTDSEILWYNGSFGISLSKLKAIFQQYDLI